MEHINDFQEHNLSSIRYTATNEHCCLFQMFPRLTDKPQYWGWCPVSANGTFNVTGLKIQFSRKDMCQFTSCSYSYCSNGVAWISYWVHFDTLKATKDPSPYLRYIILTRRCQGKEINVCLIMNNLHLKCVLWFKLRNSVYKWFCVYSLESYRSLWLIFV